MHGLPAAHLALDRSDAHRARAGALAAPRAAHARAPLLATPAPPTIVVTRARAALSLRRPYAAQAGYTEALTFALCSRDEAFKYMRKVDAGAEAAVHISNPKTIEFQVCRTSLLPGLFKTLANNKGNALPWKVFEVSDTVHVDATADVGASRFPSWHRPGLVA